MYFYFHKHQSFYYELRNRTCWNVLQLFLRSFFFLNVFCIKKIKTYQEVMHQEMSHEYPKEHPKKGGKSCCWSDNEKPGKTTKNQLQPGEQCVIINNLFYNQQADIKFAQSVHQTAATVLVSTTGINPKIQVNWTC